MAGYDLWHVRLVQLVRLEREVEERIANGTYAPHSPLMCGNGTVPQILPLWHT
jgi:hypothetical protein